MSAIDSANNYYELQMFRSSWDRENLVDFMSNKVDWSNTSRVSAAWAIAARFAYLTIFAPNNRHDSILRPSLLANGLEHLGIFYTGTVQI